MNTAGGSFNPHEGIDIEGSITSLGAITSSGSGSATTAGIGYTAGAGGVVTQLTDKSTAVTLNRLTGAVTMNNAALAAAAEASFTVNNSMVAATDCPVVAHASAGTAGSYLVGCTAVAAGSFQITVSNVSAGSLSEAIVIRFLVLKGTST